MMKTPWFKEDGSLNVEKGERVRLHAHVWMPIWVEDMSEEPIYVESKDQYKRELKARGMDCPGLH